MHRISHAIIVIAGWIVIGSLITSLVVFLLGPVIPVIAGVAVLGALVALVEWTSRPLRRTTNIALERLTGVPWSAPSRQLPAPRPTFENTDPSARPTDDGRARFERWYEKHYLGGSTAEPDLPEV